MSRYSVYAPLSHFEWEGENLPLAAGFELIRRPAEPYPLRQLDHDLTRFDRDELFFADHWLRFDWQDGSDPSDEELANLFLVALWLEQPTRAHIKFRFSVNNDPKEPAGRMSRLLGQFQWIEGAVADVVTTQALARAVQLLPLLQSALVRRLRLSNALYLTFAGCTASQWQVALACYAASAEALLTYETGAGITRRLSAAFAVLMDSTDLVRSQHFNDFRNLYGKRSDVMHGRGHLIPSADRLPLLAAFGDALRSLWRVILLSAPTTVALEGDDIVRKTFFRALQGVWVPP